MNDNKSTYIRARVTKEEKEKYQKMADEKNMTVRGTANISEILYAKLYFHLKKPKTCTLRIWLFC